MKHAPARIALCVIVLVAGAVLGPAASAATLPDWAQEIARSDPSLEEAAAHAPSRILLRDTYVTVRPDGSRRVRHRLALQVLVTDPQGVKYGSFWFGGNEKIESSRAWHLRPGKEVEKSRRLAAVDLAPDSAFLTDRKARVVVMEGVRRGSLVFFEFEVTGTPYTLTFSERFFEEGPIRLARFALETPPGWTASAAWLRLRGPDPMVSGNVRRWEIADLPAPEQVPLAQEPQERAPILVVNLVPPPGANVQPAALPDWRSVGLWYEGLLRDRDTVTPEVAAASKQAVASAGSGLTDQLRASALFVRDGVRYIAKEVGIGGYQPHAAAQTLHDRYGDCKDKGTLYQTLLAAAGQRAYPVLISLGDPDTVDWQVASPESFNHLIVAVPLPADLAVPDPLRPALVQAGGLGRLLFVDTTDEHTAFGSLSAALAGKLGLVVAGPSTRLVKLPGEDPSAHRVERRLRAEFLPDRTVSAVLTTILFGEPASHARAEYRKSSQDRRKTVEHDFMHVWPEASVVDYAVDYETQNGEFVETLSLKVAPLAPSGARAWLSIFPGAKLGLPRAPLARRQVPVFYEFARTLRYEVSLSGVPEKVPAPAPRQLQSSGWSVVTTSSREAGTLRASWEMSLSRTRFEAGAFEELRKLWSAVDSTADTIVDLSQ